MDSYDRNYTKVPQYIFKKPFKHTMMDNSAQDVKIRKTQAEKPDITKKEDIQETSVRSTKQDIILLLFCVGGIYSSFLSWSYLQEKISSTNYSKDDELAPSFYKAPLVINLIQSFFATIIGSVFLCYKTKRFQTPWQFLTEDLQVFKSFTLISITQALSSPIAYNSLNHISYLLFLLAKSCKLIPVMIVHFVIYRTKFPLYKYLVALTVTLGVITFTFSHSSQKSSNKKTNEAEDHNTLLGLCYLCLSLLLDGLTNSTQDQMFSDPKLKKKITGAHLMSGINFLNFLLTLGYTLIFTDQISYTINFFQSHGYKVFIDVLSFGFFGSVGQIFIFLTLESFNSIVLVTVTVTRKMISMCLSVILFGHTLLWSQWLGIFLVFAGIVSESAYKILEKNKKKATKQQ